MGNSLLTVKNLKLNFNSYLGVAEVLDGISFDVKENSWVGLAGESGCGKTVAAFTILRLLPESADIVNGEVIYKDRDILKLSKKEIQKIRGKEISIIFQDPQTSLNPSIRIGDCMIETLKASRRISNKEAKDVVISMLEKVKISYPKLRSNQYPHELSGGMQQRVCIALALLCNPNLLIADEFTTNLDVTIQEEILKLVLDLQKSISISILFITHDLALINKSCKYVIIMYAGQIVEKGKVSEVFKSPSHPYTKALLNSIPKIKGNKKRLESIKGFVPSLINPPKGCRFHTRCEHKIPNKCDKYFPNSFNLENEHQVWCHLYKK